MISLVESFLYSEKQGTPEEGQRVERAKCCVSTYPNKDKDKRPKNQNQNKSYMIFIDV